MPNFRKYSRARENGSTTLITSGNGGLASGGGNSDYAAVAGRLEQTHYFWGQPFNGTQDVTGSLTGVEDILASGVIHTKYIDIESDASVGGKLYVESDTKVGGNLRVNTDVSVGGRDQSVIVGL